MIMAFILLFKPEHSVKPQKGDEKKGLMTSPIYKSVEIKPFSESAFDVLRANLITFIAILFKFYRVFLDERTFESSGEFLASL